MNNRTFAFLAIAVTLLALVIRVHYVLTVTLVNAFGGDAFEYIRYASNISRGYFGSGDVPDAFRSPGYPALIAVAGKFGPTWPKIVFLLQAVLGALTVGGTILIGRAWLPAWAALGAGLLVALWPHNIAMTAELLTETLFGFLLVLALLLATRRKWLGSGLSFAAAALVNPVSLLLPLLIAPFTGQRKAAITLLAAALLIPAAWGLRPVQGGSSRMWTNLVQGSWPLYHRAYLFRTSHPEPIRIMAEINKEVALTTANPAQGLGVMLDRMSEHPGYYAKWYARKPYLLWDWDIRISAAHGPYVHEPQNSPLDRQPLLMSVAKAANPALFWLALLGAIYGLWKGPAPLRITALAFAYFTLLHTVLQAEPRYSIPYRPLEMLLALSLVSAILVRYVQVTIRR